MIGSDGHIFFVIKDHRGVVKLEACWFVSFNFHDGANLYLLINISLFTPIHQSTDKICPFMENQAEVDVTVPSEGSMLRPHCAECPPGISSHYCAMLAENTNRKEVFLILYLRFEICGHKGQVDS